MYPCVQGAGDAVLPAPAERGLHGARDGAGAVRGLRAVPPRARAGRRRRHRAGCLTHVTKYRYRKRIDILNMQRYWNPRLLGVLQAH